MQLTTDVSISKTKKKRNVLTCPVSDCFDSNCLLAAAAAAPPADAAAAALPPLAAAAAEESPAAAARLHRHCYDGAFCVFYQPLHLAGPLLPL